MRAEFGGAAQYVVICILALLLGLISNCKSDPRDNTTENNVERNEIRLPTKYKVQTGDTLRSISEKFYGDGKYWRKIAEANDIKDGPPAKTGQYAEIIIPKIELD